MKIGISSNSGMPSSILMSKIFYCQPFSKWLPFFRQLQLDPILMKICMQGKSGMTSLILLWKSQVSDSGTWEPIVVFSIASIGRQEVPTHLSDMCMLLF